MTGEEKKRIRNYYEGTQYELSNFSSNIPNLFVDTIEIFNPVKNIVQGLVNSSINNCSGQAKWEHYDPKKLNLA